MVRIRRAHARTSRARLPKLDMLADAHSADSGRAHERLVTRKGEDIDVHRLHVDRDYAGSLGRIDSKDDVVLAADLADLADRLHRAKNVGPMVHDHQLGIRANRFSDLIRFHEPLAVERDEG